MCVTSLQCDLLLVVSNCLDEREVFGAMNHVNKQINWTVGFLLSQCDHQLKHGGHFAHCPCRPLKRKLKAWLPDVQLTALSLPASR